jgi:hypothetical protein
VQKEPRIQSSETVDSCHRVCWPVLVRSYALEGLASSAAQERPPVDLDLQAIVVGKECVESLTNRTKEILMGDKKLFVERRPQGNYAVRKPDSQRASAVSPTQEEAIQRARELNPGATVLVERVRHTDVGKPDKWRKP